MCASVANCTNISDSPSPVVPRPWQDTLIGLHLIVQLEVSYFSYREFHTHTIQLEYRNDTGKLLLLINDSHIFFLRSRRDLRAALEEGSAVTPTHIKRKKKHILKASAWT